MTTTEKPIPMRQMTPEEVRLSIRDFLVFKLHESFEFADRAVQPDKSCFELLDLDDFFPLEILKWLEIDKPKGPRGILTEHSTVSDFCLFLAEQTLVPAIEPAVILGNPCLSAGAFLTIRRLLAERGVDVSKIGPSTPLFAFVYRHPWMFENLFPRMAPGRVPAVRWKNRPLMFNVLAGILVSAVTFAFWKWGGLTDAQALLVGFILAMFRLWQIAVIRSTSRQENWVLDFGGLYDFRDLVDAMLGRPLRTRAA
ncbi:hypothetical protein [Fimbriiglobus ruber]|uniref:Uncharacterized protein n=1 Tax=Fimbriiglobus ruber TaxID=1908690 RepID=A0A225E8C8_9BACT|nr:hypothetical protein [Fimbriiglobus ruber]OWK47028.1 hypothetical protein FRUB_00727 [Fimbriiglobus ruber]